MGFVRSLKTNVIYSTAAMGCQDGRFQCTNGQCIYDSHVCDGYTDCTDGSDETKETCCKLYQWTIQYNYLNCNTKYITHFL